ncbi:MAG: glycogen debranching enzyme N-terminal domain-containing protein [Candidatus Obscuribacter sp.]|nr:glycogen debranching enzyme N-terminal domain-containing protein [Candidatus Obscuribacter sp.]
MPVAAPTVRIRILISARSGHQFGKSNGCRREEWLVTNGLGSYAGAAISGANTRRYHGLFVGSLNPPVQRLVFFSRLDERVSTRGQNGALELGCNIWRSGAVTPQGISICWLSPPPRCLPSAINCRRAG